MSEYLLFTNDSIRFPTIPIALNGIGIRHLQEHVLRVGGINTHQWIQCVNGSGRLILNDKSYIIEEGSGIFLPANTPHEYYAISNQWIVNFLCFNGNSVVDMMDILGLQKPGVYSLSQPEKILEYEQMLFELYTSDIEHKVLKASGILYSLIIDLALDITKNPASQNSLSNQHMNQAIHYMETHYQESVSLSDIAQSVSLSREYLCALFKKSLGVSVFDYLLSIRLAQAKTFLVQHPQKKVKEIAAMVGYEDTSYFCSVFKKNENMTPLEFRHSRR